MTSWFYQPVVQLLGHWPYVFQHLCGIAAVNSLFEIFFVLAMFLYMPPVLVLLQFTQSQKAAFAI